MTTPILKDIQLKQTLFALLLLSAMPSLYAQNTTGTGQNRQYDDKPVSTTGSGQSRSDVKSGVTPETTYRNRQIETYRQDSTKSSGKSRSEVKAEVVQEGSLGTKQNEVSIAKPKNSKSGSTKNSTAPSGMTPATSQ